MIKRIALVLIAGICAANSIAQSVDDKIAAAMNASDWFALDSLYNVSPKDSINPFLEIFSRCLIGNRLNRPQVSIPAFTELLNTQSLDLGNLVASAHMFAVDLSRVGQNAQAASMISSIVDQTRQYLDSASIALLERTARNYAALSRFSPYQIEFPGKAVATVKFTIDPVGPKEKHSVLMHLKDCTINGADADITFDTGAGTNIISPEKAEHYGLVPLEGAVQTVDGVASREGYMAIVRELRIGDIIVRDVPFVVLSLSSNNSEADQYIDSFSIVIGSDLMLQLKELTIDFDTREITIPTHEPASSGAAPNLCFSNGMNLLTRGTVCGIPTLMCLDSGDASFGSVGAELYPQLKSFAEQNGQPDTLRSAGIAGFTISQVYNVRNLPLTLGGASVAAPEFVVNTVQQGKNPVNIGLRTLMLFRKLRFNLVDFCLTVVP